MSTLSLGPLIVQDTDHSRALLGRLEVVGLRVSSFRSDPQDPAKKKQIGAIT